jgi:WD40 repeat protein
MASLDRECGNVRLTLYRKNITHIIKAHNSKIAAMGINQDGKLLATASEKGTLVRMINTDTGSILFEVRRGSDAADIYGLAFDLSTQWLSLASNKGTIHVFGVTKQITD